MFHPVNGTYDAQLTADMQRTTSAVVGWLLMASWVYYVEQAEVSLLSDPTFDKACAWLLRHYPRVTHKYKHLLPEDALRAGTAYHLSAGVYPRGIIELAQQARQTLEKQG